jgi:hypothetical protein
MFHDVGGLGLGVRGGPGDARSQQVVALEELGVNDTIGESLASNTDTFQDTIALELIKDDDGVEIVGALSVIGDDATDEMRVGGLESVHQMVELLLVMLGLSDELGTLGSGRGAGGSGGGSSGRAGGTIELGQVFVAKEIDDELVSRLAKGKFEVGLKGISVLFQPSSGVVFDLSGIMVDNEFDLGELDLFVSRVALVVFVELGNEGLIGSFGNERFFVEGDEDTVRLLVNEVNGHLRVHSKVNEGPVDLLAGIFFLFKFEHVVVEELLELLVGIVDTDLIEAVELEDFESGNIEDTNEVVGFLDIEDSVHAPHDPREETTVDGFGEGITRVGSLLNGEMGLNEFGTGLDSRFAEGFVEDGGGDIEEFGGNIKFAFVLDLRAFSVTLHEGDVTQVEDGRDQSVEAATFIRVDTTDVHGEDGVLEFVDVIHVLDRGTGGEGEIVESLRRGENESLLLIGIGTSQKLVENVERSLAFSSVDDTSLLEEV